MQIPQTLCPELSQTFQKHFYLVCKHTDVPGPPGKPQFDKVDVTSVTISWTKPLSDGGAPITSYIIEKQERFSTRWTRVNVEPVEGFTYHITDLVQGDEYSFRVAAQNKAGVGKPSEPSQPVVPKLPYGKSN